MYRRGNIYYYDVYVNGRRVRGSTKQKTKAEAKLVEAKVIEELTKEYDVRNDRLFSAAAIKYLNEVQDRSSLEDIERSIRFLHQHLKGKLLVDIDHDNIEKIIQSKLSQGVSNATVNRLTATLKAILNKAKKEWKWIDTIPHIRSLKESKGRERYLTKEEAGRLISMAPNYMKDIILFALMTGQRKSNVLGVRWDQVNFELKQWTIPASEFKNGHKHTVQLNDTALEILDRLKHNGSEYVFLNSKNNHVISINKVWEKIVKDAGLDDLRFHDLRHTWATWFLIATGSMVALKKAGGWRSESMLYRYAHICEDGLNDAVNRLSLS